jgi:hypothetical protein
MEASRKTRKGRGPNLVGCWKVVVKGCAVAACRDLAKSRSLRDDKQKLSGPQKLVAETDDEAGTDGKQADRG